ncbi:MAG: 2Fe-2S iron-sulfur cluster binding domain-containing protein [Gammaproteobacteria bacterium]|nr:2Fe-2S iron-sulfur cluster binding domain-containing protein [Gammaproteobacteria bacterium]
MPTFVVKNREGIETRLSAQTGISLMENIRDLDASVDAICGGLCSCATCHVFIEPDWAERLPGRSPEETMLLENSDSFDSERSRLSCQILVTNELDGLRLEVAPSEF